MEEQIRIEGAIPKIISKELWDKVSALQSIGHKGKCRSKHTYLLSGLVYCQCGNKIYGNVHGNGQGQYYYAYRCSSQHSKHDCLIKEVRADYLDAYVVDCLLNKFFQENTISMITEQLNQTLQTHEDSGNEEFIRYKESLQILTKSRKNLLEALKETGYSKSIGEELKNVDDQIQKCNLFLEEAKAKQNKTYVSEQEVSNSVGKIKEFAKKNNKNEIQAMLRQYVERVTVFESHIEVTYKIAVLLHDEEKQYFSWQEKTTVNDLKYKEDHGLLSEFSKHNSIQKTSA